MFKFKALASIIFSLSVHATAEPSGIGFYSGTFDPPTKAHLEIIKCAIGEVENNESCKELSTKIKQLIVSVNKDGEKDTLTSSVERVLMLKKALEKYGKRIEVVASTPRDRDQIKAKIAQDNTDLYQLIGEDSFLALKPEVLSPVTVKEGIGKSKFIVLPRESESSGSENNNHFNVDSSSISSNLQKMALKHSDLVVLFPKLDAKLSTLSSTKARNNIINGISISEIVDPLIEEMIHDSGFYLKLPSELNELNSIMFKEGFSDFIEDIENACPNILYLNPERCTEILEGIRTRSKISYKESQSESRWGEKYVEAVLKTIEDEKERALFSKNIPYMITAVFQGKPYGKLPHLTPVKIKHSPSFKNPINPVLSISKPLQLSDLNCSADLSFKDKSNYNMDIDRYLYDRFPFGLKNFLLRKQMDEQLSANSLFISNLSLNEIINPLNLTSSNPEAEEYFLIQTRRGQPHRKLYLGYNGTTKKYRLIATQVLGVDRRANVFCQLKLSGIFNKYYDLTYGSSNNFFQFNDQGNKLQIMPNDILLFGFKTAWIEEILKDSTTIWKRTKLTFESQADLELFENTNKSGNFQRIIFARNVFGDEASFIIESLYKKGLRKVIYLGTAGALIDLPVGTITIPTNFVDQSLNSIKFDQSWAMDLIKASPLKQSIQSDMKHSWAPHLFDETVSQLIRWRKHGVASIDVEGFHLAKFREAHPDLQMANFYIISDQTLGKLTIDQSNSQTKKIATSVHDLIKAILPQILY